MKLSPRLYHLARWVYDQEQSALKLTCKHLGHVPGKCTYFIDRGPTCEGVDYEGCLRCKTRLGKYL